MIQFTHIVCPVDLTDLSIRPLAYAGRLAEQHHARLTALHVVPTFEPTEVRTGALFDPVRVVEPLPREAVLEALGRALEAAGVSTANVTLAAEAGQAAETIVTQALALDADLLVMSTHGRHGVDRLILGSVTEEVLQTAPCPVLTLPPHAPAHPPADAAFDRILCPVDFSPAAKRAVGFALDLAAQGDASVTFVHVLEWLAEGKPRAHAHFDVSAYREYMKEDALDQMQALIADAGRTPPGTEPRVVVGRAYREILRIAAEETADLIVMGAQGRGGPGLTLFGSTTEQVVRAAPCPVLTVRGETIAP